MSDYSTLTLNIDGSGVATLALARPDKRNAISGTMLDELMEVLSALEADETVRAVILTGEGSHFCAGGDLAYMRQQIDSDREGRLAEARKLARVLTKLNDLSKPVIGRINGSALGGGLGLIAACDVAIAVQGAEFGFTETRLGLLPATIGPYVMARMGEAKARRVFMSGRLFSANEAVNLDLVARAVPAESLDQAVEAEVAPYLSAAPKAVAAAKRLARSFGPAIDEAVIERVIASLADAWEGEEALHGIESFLAKRSPRWALPVETDR